MTFRIGGARAAPSARVASGVFGFWDETRSVCDSSDDESEAPIMAGLIRDVPMNFDEDGVRGLNRKCFVRST